MNPIQLTVENILTRLHSWPEAKQYSKLNWSTWSSSKNSFFSAILDIPSQFNTFLLNNCEYFKTTFSVSLILSFYTNDINWTTRELKPHNNSLTKERNLDHGSYSHYCEAENSFYSWVFKVELSLFLWFFNHIEWFAIWQVPLPERNLDHGSYSHYCLKNSSLIELGISILSFFNWLLNCVFVISRNHSDLSHLMIVLVDVKSRLW